MVNEEEGYATVNRALDVLLEETKKTLSNTEKLRETATQEETDMIIHKNTEIAKLTHEISELKAKKAQKSRPFDEKMAQLKAEIQKIEETKKAIAVGLARKKVEPETKEQEQMLMEGMDDSVGKGEVKEQGNDNIPPEVQTKKQLKKPFGVGQHNRPTVSSVLVDLIEELLDEGRWETRQTISEHLIKAGYPSKHTELYASKGVNVLKWKGKAVSYSVGKSVYWRSVKFPNIPIPKVNGGK